MNNDLQQNLAAPFEPSEVKWRPAAVSGNRARAIGYVTARAVMDRLDDVLGVNNWQDEYELLPDGCVLCRLSIRLGEEWIAKVDVGGPSDQPDSGDRLKAAFSDALKRAAVKYGIGRYLYRLPAAWVDYDPQRKQLVRTPALPAWALPERPASSPRVITPPAGNGKLVPVGMANLRQRLETYEASLVSRGLCQPGELEAELLALAAEQGWPADPSLWNADQVHAAGTAARRFEAMRIQNART